MIRFARKSSFFLGLRNSSSLIVAEHNGLVVSPSTLATVSAATKIGHDITLLVFGHNISAVSESASKIIGAKKVIAVDCEKLENGSPEDISDMIVGIAKDYSHILAPSSNHGKNYLPRAAALLDCAPLSDVIGIVDESTFKRPMYAGNAISIVQMLDEKKFLLVRPTAFEKAEIGGQASASVEKLSLESSFSKSSSTSSSKFISKNENKSERPDLGTARVVVSGGRGMKSGENFQMLETMADKLKGAVGASRAAVDAGFVPNDYQVGQTGKVVAPDLYIAVGISGAIQHLSGMKDSKTIVAINKDKDAPIFQVADYGLVDDLFKVVPDMNNKL